MKRSGFKQKSYEEKIAILKNKKGSTLKRTRIRVVGKSTTAQNKKEIQRLLREIVILRDKKCILHGKRCYHEYEKDKDNVVWQAEHLIERSNSATYSDLRLVVLVCKNCHGWKHFKKSNHDQYDEWVKQKLSPERVKHWDRCRESSWRATKVDWTLEKIALEQELKKLYENIHN